MNFPTSNLHVFDNVLLFIIMYVVNNNEKQKRKHIFYDDGNSDEKWVTYVNFKQKRSWSNLSNELLQMVVYIRSGY